jgi:hypothetical protein
VSFVADLGLTSFSAMSENTKAAKKLGRDEEIKPAELLRRYAALKRFLEDNWGRIGLDLPRVRKPDDVKSVLNREVAPSI